MSLIKNLPGYNKLVSLQNHGRSTLLYRPISNYRAKKYLSSTTTPKLQIGCGTNFHEGWLNTDLVPYSGRVAFLDASKSFPFNDNTFEYIYSEHIFEHLTFEGQCNMISESLRTLKPNGVFRLATPSVDFLYTLYKDPDNPKYKEYLDWAGNLFCSEVAQVLEGNSNNMEVYVINNFYRAWGHKMIHNLKSLKELVLKQGFSRVQKKDIDVSDIEELCNMEKHGQIIPNEFNLMETMVIEATKS